MEYELKFNDIPYFPAYNMPGHEGRFIFGTLEGHYVACMSGRLHLYQGFTPFQVISPLYVMNQLGAQTLIITNASGGIRSDLHSGDFVLITDQINMTGQVAFDFPGDSRYYNAIPDMTYAYTPELHSKAYAAAKKCGISLKEGVYIGVHGPQFETPAEIRAFRTLGADLVGMSTVLEVIAAASCNMQVLGLSLVTNLAAGLSENKISGKDVLMTSTERGEAFSQLLLTLIRDW